MVGSTAAAAWGVVRTTRDVDLVAVIDRSSAQAVIEQLITSDLYVPTTEAATAIERGGSFNVLHPATGGKVDIFAASVDDAFTRSRLDRRVRAEVLGVPTFVATPEDVILAKLRWRLESRSEVQWRDCVEIAATQPLDHGYLWRWADELGVSEDLEELLADSSA